MAEPEVWFRIVHVSRDVCPSSGGPARYDQTVEIALGSRAAFGNANVGTVARRVAADKVVSAVPPSVGKHRPLSVPRTPRVVELLRKAMRWQALLDSGHVASQAEIARREGITRARVTQVIGMLRLAPQIRRQILTMPAVVRRPVVTERALRSIVRLPVRRQKAAYRALVAPSQRPVTR